MAGHVITNRERCLVGAVLIYLLRFFQVGGSWPEQAMMAAVSGLLFVCAASSPIGRFLSALRHDSAVPAGARLGPAALRSPLYGVVAIAAAADILVTAWWALSPALDAGWGAS